MSAKMNTFRLHQERGLLYCHRDCSIVIEMCAACVLQHPWLIIQYQKTPDRFIIEVLRCIAGSHNGRHYMKTVSALLALCQGNPQEAGGFSSQRPVMRTLQFSFDVIMDQPLNKQSRSLMASTILMLKKIINKHELWRITRPIRHATLGSRYYAGTLSLIQLIIAHNLKIRHSGVDPQMPHL